MQVKNSRKLLRELEMTEPELQSFIDVMATLFVKDREWTTAWIEKMTDRANKLAAKMAKSEVSNIKQMKGN